MTEPEDVRITAATRTPVPAPADDRALARERAYHDTCRAALAGMVDDADDQVVIGENAFASGADAEVLGHWLRSRAKELKEEPDGPLFFGRLDFADDESAGDHRRQSYHIGRRRITERKRGQTAPPLVVDWRAPVSRTFYQAGSRDPQGVSVRRRFGWAPFSRGDSSDLTGLEDEHLVPGELPGDLPGEPLGKPAPAGSVPGPASVPDPAAETGALAAPEPSADAVVGAAPDPAAGPDPAGAAHPAGVTSAIVAGEIERPRVGPMRDIAATIQPEQDDLVRSDLTRSLCVQGAPGTGKTAVGLHRAAYLLYTHPQRVRRGGLLILGPNRAFLSYISQVLPSLGERDIRQSTLQEEIARHEALAVDSPAAAAVKHDVRMAEVLHRALYARVAPPAGPLAVPDGSYRWRVPLGGLERIVEEVREEAPPYSVGRERVRSRVVRAVRLQAERRAGPRGNAWAQRVGRSRPVTALLDTVWPRTGPEEVLAALLTDPAAVPGLTRDEQDAIRWRKPPRTHRSARWSEADLVLLDELAGLLERPGGYGHVVVDEAQDLSPMECRAIARRSDFGSLTVLGDLAQGTTPWAATTWRGQLAHLGKPDAAVIPLTTGFRVPAVIVGLANRLVGALGVDVPAARSLRRDGALSIRRVGDLAAATVDAVRAALAREGSIGVIAAEPDTHRLRTALTAAGIPLDGGPGTVPVQVDRGPGAVPVQGDGGPGAAPDVRVTVLPATLAKGLEYDHVVVAEPAAVVAAEARGLHRLYVVLTRAVSGLDVLHERPLPAELRTGPGEPETA
ncbi:HelD family protein [Streptomyces sp. NPDC051018]|uniref:HelD family protein n=1 Tax=Streptomyces sp. NPDC051018 TaxID=3365639 RepID=UPI00378DBB55